MQLETYGRYLWLRQVEMKQWAASKQADDSAEQWLEFTASGRLTLHQPQLLLGGRQLEWDWGRKLNDEQVVQRSYDALISSCNNNIANKSHQ